MPLPRDVIDQIIKPEQYHLFNGELLKLITSAVEAGYAAGCEDAALIVETKTVPLGFERRYFARAIRSWAKEVLEGS